ncbi:uncharacterized protein FOMMEDRAFT_22905 [Fomitiporia mediterranea MF3/22]|uniref:uncharacterized protein n=1 Tax=Fomitiporia mediterranea (strain MF3/22) TaxID=694068 RepID=UPI00044075E6|nr:uncharacterized protein FOMMEDRAFT_22905 [Fomitiporia mediterranea MF3/22]EJC99868.1 hypothetical protein FOMMEDRAFT_22905 [Fomitiporia mediterranea MF3/22]
MSLVRKKPSKELVDDVAPQAVHVRSIQVDYKDVQRKRPVTVEIKTDSEMLHRSCRYGRNEAIDWNPDIQVALGIQLVIVIRECRQLHSDKEIVIPIIITDDLIMKPILDIDEPNGKKISLRIYFEAAGPFIDLIRRLVETSQSKLGSMKEFMKNVGKACEVLNYIVNTMELASGTHPSVGTAVSAVRELYEKCKDVKECYEAAASLMADVASFLPFVEVPQARTRSNISNETADKILELFEKISRMLIEYSDNTAIGIFLRSRIDDVDAYKEELRRLKETFDWCIKTEVWKAVLTTEKHTEALVLDKLQPVMQAFYEREKTCSERTRKETLQAIEDWSTSDLKLLWLHGPGGAGKSAIAHTVAQRFREQKRLAGCFFCNKNDANAKLRDAKSIMPTIASQFASWHADYRSIVVTMLEGQGNFDLHAGLQDQFDLLVKQPIALSSAHMPPKHRPLIIILDALDECCESQSSRRYLAKFVKDIANVAPWLKVFVSSRKLPELEDCFGDSDFKHIDISNPLVDLGYDVAAYVKFCLGNKKCSNDHIDLHEFKAHQLLARIRAAFMTLDPGVDVDFLDSMSGQAIVDNLLRITMESIVGRRESLVSDEETMPAARAVLSLIIRTGPEWSLTGDMILFCLQDDLPKFTAQTLNTVLAAVRPLLYTGNNGTIQTSFPKDMVRDYVDNQGSSGRFWVDPSVAHMNLAHGCFHVLHMQLKFNICSLESLHLKNEDVPYLSSVVEAKIPESLRYSSLYWMYHVLQAENDRELRSPVVELLCSPRALFWIEVLVLLGSLEKAKGILLQCIDRFKEVDEIAHAATELHGFISAFHDAIAVSTSHLYVSALMWFQPDSLVVQCASDAFMGRKSPLSDDPPQHIPLANTSKSTLLKKVNISRLKGDTRNIREAKYTPDRRKIVSYLDNGMLQIWDTKSGEAIGEPFEYHVPAIHAIAYSPDGSRIVLGYDDGKLRIWDAHTGSLVIESQQRHRYGISSIAYSPDGTRIVSGSDDETLRMWDAQSGACVGEPLTCHTDWVNAVAYAPDGRRIVSGSYDGTLRIWDAQNGALVGGSISGHKDSIFAVAYAPDGSRFVSGSKDNTLRIWDVQSGEPIGEPLKGHIDWVRSVAYSPDGTRIVSGSDDGTLRVWDARSGTPVGEPLSGHSGWVWGVAYAPDGSRIVSGSHNKTLRVWDAHSGEPIGEPLSGHESWVVSVAYSPDGNRIASGSWDGTIRIWDAHTGACIKTMFPYESRWDPDAQCFLTVASNLRTFFIAHTTNPSTIPDDGWVRTLDGSLFLWVPLEHQRSICHTGQVRIPNNKDGKVMYMDWTKIPHGKDWAKIMSVKGSDKD